MTPARSRLRVASRPPRPKVVVLEKKPGADDLAVFTFDPPYDRRPDVTPRIVAKDRAEAWAEIVEVTRHGCTIRARAAVKKSPIVVSLRVEEL